MKKTSKYTCAVTGTEKLNARHFKKQIEVQVHLNDPVCDWRGVHNWMGVVMPKADAKKFHKELGALIRALK